MSIDHLAISIGRAARVPLLALFVVAPVAGAGAFEVTAEQRDACTPDAFRLCSAAIPDVGRVTACMPANKARLSPPCRAVFQTVRLEEMAPSAHKAPAHKAASAHRHLRSRATHRHIWARS
jgi:hypothetical protein